MNELLAFLQQKQNDRLLEAELRRRRLADPWAPDFCVTPRTERLASSRADDVSVPERPFVLVVAVPSPPGGAMWQVGDAEVWQWLEPRERRYAPDTEVAFLPGLRRATHGGIISAPPQDKTERTLRGYVVVERSGVVEMGLMDSVVRCWDAERAFLLVAVIGRLWQFIGFVCEFYDRFGQSRPFTLLLNLRPTRDMLLGGLASGWRGPWDGFRSYRPMCWEPAVQIRKDGVGPGLDGPSIAELVRATAAEVEAAWGHGGPDCPPRCYVHRDSDPAEPFDAQRFRSFVR